MSRKVSHFILTIVLVGILGILSTTNGSIVPANSFPINQDVVNNDDILAGRKFGVEIHNEDSDLDAISLMRKYGYQGETHEVVTTDGYILEMHRITGPISDSDPKGKKVAFIMPGLSSSSIDWIISGTEKTFAYILADKGYDVWLGNRRANEHSRTHQEYSVTDEKLWMFSLQDVETEDLPAQIDYIIEKTGQKKILKNGHSKVTTTFFAMKSVKPENREEIYAYVAIAPLGSSASCSCSSSSG